MLEVPFAFFIAKARRDPRYDHFDYDSMSIVLKNKSRIAINDFYPGVVVLYIPDLEED